MNILREIRRVKEKNMIVRIIFVLLFCVIFLINTYAWFSAGKELNIGGIEGQVNSWDVAYYIDDEEILDETTTFTIESLYPGMPNREDIIYIYNLGNSSTTINCEVISVKVFGQEVLEKLKTDGEIQTDGNTTNIFSNDNQYPFNISYTYDKTNLTGEYVDAETTPDSVGKVSFNSSWDYMADNTTEEEAKNILDTKFGKDAYAYYQDEANDPTKAIQIQLRITSTMIHPNNESNNS